MVEILLVVLIVVVSSAVAFLVYHILSIRKELTSKLNNMECSLAQEELDLEIGIDEEASLLEDEEL